MVILHSYIAAPGQTGCFFRDAAMALPCLLETFSFHRMAAMQMWDGDFGILPVLEDGGKVVGVITDRDICEGAGGWEGGIKSAGCRRHTSSDLRPSRSDAGCSTVSTAPTVGRVMIDYSDGPGGLPGSAEYRRKNRCQEIAELSQRAPRNGLRT